MPKRLESQINAEKKYQSKRKGTPMIPIIYLSEDDAKLVERLRAKYGSKKDGVVTAIRGWCELLDAQERVSEGKAG
jgi:hypothetical protein